MITDSANKMTRSAHGLDNGQDDPWWHRSACRTNPDLFLDAGEGDAARAIHICRSHCPVLAQCDADTRHRTPIGVVQAGLRWTETVTAYRQGPTATQPRPAGCGPWCADLRRNSQ